jgi:superoxide dismutase, Fe-Mn family
MPFELTPLPFAEDALAPHISAETLSIHHGKHHAAYVAKLNDLTKDTEWENQSLEAIIQGASGALFNNAAQVWNHDFYWQSLTPGSCDLPESVEKALTEHFGSVDHFKEQFTAKALSQFGSGWAWLVQNEQGALEIISTSNADTPMCANLKPMLTCDVWEHAYYVDVRNRRPDYLKNFWACVNWQCIEDNMS